MANEPFRELMAIARDFVNPIFAQSLLLEFCKENDTDPENINSGHLMHLVLYMSGNKKLSEKLKPHEFSNMMNKFMSASNKLAHENKNATKEFVKQYRKEKFGE